MSLWRPDPTFYPSPKLAMQAPPEKLAYVAMLNANGNHRPDALGVVDVDPQSNAYGRLVGQLDMPNVGDELHHFGWNACSASLCPYAPHPHIERRYLIVPGHQFVAHPYRRHQARSEEAADRQSDRTGNAGSAYRLRVAAHHSLRSGRNLHQRAGRRQRRWPRRHLHDGSRQLRHSREVGARSRPAISGLRFLVALGPGHRRHQRMGHAQHGAAWNQSRDSSQRRLRAQTAHLGSAQAPSFAGAGSRRRISNGAGASSRRTIPRALMDSWALWSR